MFQKIVIVALIWAFTLWLSLIFTDQMYPSYSKLKCSPEAIENVTYSTLPKPLDPYPYRTLYAFKTRNEYNLEVRAEGFPCDVPFQARTRSLVLYSYTYLPDHHADVENINFFIKHAVERFFERDQGAVDYVFIINNRTHPGVEFPRLCNIWVIYRDPSTDFCAFRDVLGSGIVDLTLYEYFFFITPSVVGPLIPNYWLDSWWKPFVNIFNSDDRIKLVGPYVNCEISPHVQASMFVTNVEGLKAISTLWGCYTPSETITKIEVAQSAYLLSQGYLIASMMHFYDSVFFNQTCNAGFNPFAKGIGTSKENRYYPHFFELIFVRRYPGKSKEYDMFLEQANYQREHCYDCWKRLRCKQRCKIPY